MTNSALDILKKVERLKHEDKEWLLAKLATATRRHSPVTEAEFESRLELLAIIEPRDDSRKKNRGPATGFAPSPTKGKPASEIILEERR